ncbi:hypothetical protein SCHPADRAFT_675098 [Schizopora paradoxa]|uniref:Uncharacterized protein n=1 Tax=Schizopora paradoxa TaxID=27342 RepID=A0A0H2RPX8_9AGAM|nr:hypothetical protein SCHPADRAFT_675098 [Schizopora paradoxa]
MSDSSPNDSSPSTPEGGQSSPPVLTGASGSNNVSLDINDQTPLIEILEKVEKDLGDHFMQALHRLDTAFTLPEAAIKLSKGLHAWREEVVLLFPCRKGKSSAAQRKPITPDKAGDSQRNASTKDSSGSAGTKPDALSDGLGLRLIKRTRPHLGVRFVSKRGQLVDNQTWAGFLEASKTLSRNFLRFLSALHYLSECQRTWCATATGEIVVTLEEMCVALRSVAEDKSPPLSNLAPEKTPVKKGSRNPKKDSDLRTFIAVRLHVCQVQLSNLLEAMGDYERNEINHIRGIQNRAFDGLRNVTTVSTFFAGVIGEP